MKNNKSEIYTVATAHLDTSWLWLLEQTIADYIPDTLKKNFRLLEKYPDYKFNFEGSYRYELIKEYYPKEFEKIKKYVREGRWHPAGACYENGDVNIPSPEALIRNILYGNGFFRDELGVESDDIFLPDCFGFGRALPSVAAHSGLRGFSTGKLFWGSSVQIPFDTGRWKGIDGKGLWAALMPFSYTTAFKRMDKAHRVLQKTEDNIKKNLPAFTLAYHGTGDRGGAPHKSSVKNVVRGINKNSASDMKVYSATTLEFFEMLEKMPEEEKSRMPVFDGEFLLTAHGTGSYTSRTVTKRWNRRSELLGDAAERFSVAAFIHGRAPYPQTVLDKAWKNVLAHHFHDDITGTSFQECYRRSHNDYILAMNSFSSEYTASVKALSELLDTSFVKGKAVIVSNPNQSLSVRKEACRVITEEDGEYFCVFDKDGNEVPSQTKILADGKREIIFIARVPSCGLAVYDIRKAEQESVLDTKLYMSEGVIENRYLRVKTDENGDISEIYDKRLGRELLSSPIRLALMNNVESFDWPAWEIKYEDISEAPYMYPGKPQLEAVRQGNAVCALGITRKAGSSVFRQIISLDCESEYVSVYNETDWREEATLLKAEFPLSAENNMACYDIGMGYTLRETDKKELYEVPAQKWAGIKDEKDGFGVYIFSDSRTGWDKPQKNTLRLTLMHTPMASYRWECSQHLLDMGLNRYSFAIAGFEGEKDGVSSLADNFCQPLHTFVTHKHEGALGREFSLLSLSTEAVRITAIKKAQSSDRTVFRVVECEGRDHKDIKAEFCLPIKRIYEIRGDEKIIEELPSEGNSFTFGIGHNGIKSFALEFAYEGEQKNTGVPIALDFNHTGITSDRDFSSSTLRGGISLPRENLPSGFVSAGTEYVFSQQEKNCIVCNGEKVRAEGDFSHIRFLAASLSGDKTAEFISDGEKIRVYIPDSTCPLGQWDLIGLGETGYIKKASQAFFTTHTHSLKGNVIAKQFYLFEAQVPLGKTGEVILPKDSDIVIFAATAVKDGNGFFCGSEQADRLEKRAFDYTFSPYAVKRMKPSFSERILDRFIDRTRTFPFRDGEFYNKYAVNEVYYILRNLSNKISYKKNVQRLKDTRKNLSGRG